MSTSEFKFGDRLIHGARPEWGAGVVTAAQTITENGVKCQRLTLRFERAGLKTISTAHATLHPATAPAPTGTDPADPADSQVNGDGGWLAQLEAGDPGEIMARLPEAAHDPFASLSSRLKATLGLYRFTDQGAPLLDWAAMQTRLADPLSHFSRHELESFFRRFAKARDEQLKQLAAEVQKDRPNDLAPIIEAAPAAGREALRRIH